MKNNLELETLFLQSLDIFGYTIKYQQNLYLLNCCYYYFNNINHDEDYLKQRDVVAIDFCYWQNRENPHIWITIPKTNNNPNHYIEKFSHDNDLSYKRVCNYINIYVKKYFPNIWAIYLDSLENK